MESGGGRVRNMKGGEEGMGMERGKREEVGCREEGDSGRRGRAAVTCQGYAGQREERREEVGKHQQLEKQKSNNVVYTIWVNVT